MKLSQRTAHQFTTIIQETEQLRQLSTDIQNQLHTLPGLYHQTLISGNLKGAHQLYTTWQQHQKEYTARFEPFEPYKLYHHYSTLSLWRNAIQEPYPLTPVLIASLGATLIAATSGAILPATIFIILTTTLLHQRYVNYLESHPHHIFSSHLTEEQRRLLHDRFLIIGNVRVELSQHGQLLDTSFGQTFKNWQAFHHTPLEETYFTIQEYPDFEKEILKSLRSGFIRHQVRRTALHLNTAIT